MLELLLVNEFISLKAGLYRPSFFFFFLGFCFF